MAYDRSERHERSGRPSGFDRDRHRGERERGRSEPRDEDRNIPDSYAEDRYMQDWLRDEEDRNRERAEYRGRGFERGYGERRPERRHERERDERGFFERAGDEISSWFGDEHAERRRQREASGGRERGEDRSYRPMAWTASDRDYRSGEPYGEPSFGRSSQEPGLERDRIGRGSEWERDDYRRTSFAGSSAGTNRDDVHYEEWRRRQMAQLDKDYDDYCRENEARFESDFGQWRQQREGKRRLLGQIREHAEVVGKDGAHVGTVDCVRGDRIVLTKSDPDSGGIHHSIGCTMIDKVDDGKVMLDVDAEQAKQRWRDEEGSGAMFRDEEQGTGPHVLNRSFSGTYR